MTQRRKRVVAIDARGYFTRGGIGRYTRHLVGELASRAGAGMALRLLISRQHRREDLELPHGNAVDVVVSRAAWMDPREERAFLNDEVRDAEVFHSLSGHWLPDRVPSVATVHDLIPIVRPRLVPAEIRRFGQAVAAALPRASHIIAVSAATADDVARVLGPRIPPVTVVHEAAAPLFRPDVAVASVLWRYGLLARGFMLAVSALNPHKNIARLVDAYAAADIAAPLVIVGAERQSATDVQLAIARNRLTGRVRLMGRVTDEDLAALYASCRAFVYPSLYEGFGLPLVEAMACGAAAVASNSASIPEVAGDAALLVDASRISALASGLKRIDRDENLRQDLRRRALERARQFSWARAAASTLDIYAGQLQAVAA